MAHIVALIAAVLFLNITAVYAGDGNGFRKHPLHLSSTELFELFESPDRSEPAAVKKFNDKVLDHVANDRVGLGGFLTLLPTKPNKKGEAKPPAFAFVARASGGTLVSVTRPGATTDPDERLFLQRTVVSDVMSQQKFSVSVYEDHALDGRALKFVGIGARFAMRPTLKLLGWGLRLQLFGSYHPEHGGTAYFAISGRPGKGDGPDLDAGPSPTSLLGSQP